MIINLISPKGEKKAIKLGFFSFSNEKEVKKLLKFGWTCESEKDADIILKRNLF